MKQKYEEPSYWDDQRSAYQAVYDEQLKDYRRFAAWLVGETTDANGTRLRGKLGRTRGPLSNLTSLAIRVARSNLFFRNPRFMVKALPGLGANPAAAKIALAETLLLNDAVEEVDMYREGRRTILDGLIGPEMVMKVGYSADVGVDWDRVETETELANSESMAILAGGRPRIKPTDADKCHSEAHDRAIAAAERGDLPMDRKSLEYLKKHKKMHDDRLKDGGDRPLETVRYESVFVTRVSPLRFARDPMASRDAERGWVQEAFLRSVDDVRENEEYDAEARKEVEATGPMGMTDDGRMQPLECPDDFVVLYETIDLRRSKVITYAANGKKPLQVKDYKDQRIFPGGNYITASFLEDPITDSGVAMPRVYEGHQEYLSTWDEVGAQTLMRGVPVRVVKRGTFDADTLKKLQNKRRVSDAWVVAADVDPTSDINKMIQQLDPPVIPEFLFALRAQHERGIERQTGGSAQLGGGDFSKTATASAVVQETGSNISEDLASVLDDFLSRVGRAMVRVMRRYPVAKVAEIAGEEVIKFWPTKWTTREIVRDRGVSVVPGSSRRKNVAVEQKLLTDLYVAVQGNPNIGAEVGVELFRRVLDASGVHGVDLGGMEEMMKMADIDQMMGAGGPQEEGPPPGGGGAAGGPPSRGKAARRGKARGSGERADQSSGRNNIGGGRMPTGGGR